MNRKKEARVRFLGCCGHDPGHAYVSKTSEKMFLCICLGSTLQVTDSGYGWGLIIYLIFFTSPGVGQCTCPMPFSSQQ